jgi:GMP synthase (glutamine-hydrolysing)
LSNRMLSNICIIDAGGQYTKVIDRRIRELNVKSEIVGTNASLDQLKACDGIIISGGPSSVTDANAPQLSKEIFNLDVPILEFVGGCNL